MFFRLRFEQKYCHNAEFISPNGNISNILLVYLRTGSHGIIIIIVII